MKFPSYATPKPRFRPQVEHSEPRFLLSAGGAAHAHTEATRSLIPAAEIKDRYAYHLVGVVKDNTPIYSLYVTNDTADNLTVSLTTPDTRKTIRNFNNGESFTANEDILMFTDEKNAWKFVLDLRVGGKDIKGSFSFKPTNGMETSVSKGYKFHPTPGWFNADLGLSKQYKVQIEGKGADRKLALMPAL